MFFLRKEIFKLIIILKILLFMIFEINLGFYIN